MPEEATTTTQTGNAGEGTTHNQATTTSSANGTETKGGGTESTSTEPVKLPDDHPLVKAFTSTKDELSTAKAKLKEFEDRDKSDTEKLTEERDQLRADVATRAAENAKLKAAIDHGLSAADLELLGDGTPEQIAERAKKLAERLGDNVTRRPDPLLGQEGSTGKADPDAWLRAAARP